MNVFLEVKRRPPSTGGNYTPNDSANTVIDPYLKELQLLGLSFPKSIVYAKLEMCGYIHDRAVTHFLADHPDETTIQTPNAVELQSLIQQYHAPQTSSVCMKYFQGQTKLIISF